MDAVTVPPSDLGSPQIDHFADVRDRVLRSVGSTPKSYDYPWLQRGYMMQFLELERAVAEEMRKVTGGSLQDRAILDIGCGNGAWLCEFVKWGALPEQVTGIELLPDRAAQARELCPAKVNIVCGDAAQMDFPDASFDVVTLFLAMCMMYEDELRHRVAAEALRVLKPGGSILWYDYRYQRPDQKGLMRSTRKGEIKRLFPGCEYHLRSIHPFPPLSRRLASVWPSAWNLLNLIPPLRTSLVGSIIKPA